MVPSHHQFQARSDAENVLKTAKLDEESIVRRTILSEYWGTKAKAYEAEAAETRRTLEERTEKEYEENLDGVYDEWAGREYVRARMQVEAPGYSDLNRTGNRFGLFCRNGGDVDPNGQGDELDDGESTFAYEPGVDTRDAFVFSSSPNVTYEERSFALSDAEADAAGHKVLYDALRRDSKQLSESIERMCQLREIAERDAYQVMQEMKLDNLSLRGPPRRTPTTAEIETIHDRNRRIEELEARIFDLQHSIDISDKKKRSGDAQMLSLAKMIASSKPSIEALKGNVSEVNGELGMLPVVLGRSLAHVKGLSTHTANPKEFQAAVLHQSKYVAMQDMGNTLSKLHRQRVQLDRGLWVARMGEESIKDEAGRSNKYPHIIYHIGYHTRLLHNAHCYLSLFMCITFLCS